MLVKDITAIFPTFNRPEAGTYLTRDPSGRAYRIVRDDLEPGRTGPWRLDIAGVGTWESFDAGAGFPTFRAAKAFLACRIGWATRNLPARDDPYRWGPEGAPDYMRATAPEADREDDFRRGMTVGAVLETA